MEYEDKFLHNWEEVYKKGQLTFWILLALKEQPRFLEEIKLFVTERTNGTLTCEDQSLYRALRRFYDIEVVNYEFKDGKRGPQRKHYQLTPMGKNLLNKFIDHNIKLFYDNSLQALILENKKKGGEEK